MDWIIPIVVMLLIVVVLSVLWCNALERSIDDCKDYKNPDIWDWP